MADINNNDIWIDVETLAKLKNITRRAVRLALNQNKYEYKVENIRGGKTYKIKLSTFEEELQLKYFQEYYDDYKTCDNEVIELSNFNIKQEKLISENQRKIALAKYDLIYAWLDFRKEYKRDKLKTGGNIPDKEFLQLYNTGMFQEEIFKTLGKVSIGSLYRWRALLDYNKDWTALVGQYKYSTRKEYRTTLNEEQIKIFIQILLSPSAFSIGKAISLTKHILKKRGQEILPKDITFRRYGDYTAIRKRKVYYTKMMESFMKYFEVFKAGNYPQGKFTKEEVQELAKNYDPSFCEAPITLDHEQKGPAYGWVDKLKEEDGMLKASFKDLSDDLKEFVNKGKYKKISVEIYRELEGEKAIFKGCFFLGCINPSSKRNGAG